MSFRAKFFSLCFLFLPFCASAGVAGSLRANWGTALDSEAPKSSLALETELRFPHTRDFFGFALATLDRPMDAYEPLAFPKISVGTQKALRTTKRLNGRATLALSALDLHRWNLDGSSLRPTLQTDWSVSPFTDFWFGARAGVFVQAMTYTQTASGSERPRWGVNQKVYVTAQYGRLSLESSVYFEQRYTAGWANIIDFANELSFSVDPQIRIGVSHQTKNGIVDETTGLFGGVRYFDSRESRLGVFAAAEI